MDVKCKWCGKPKRNHFEDGMYCKPKPNWPKGEEHDSLTFEPEFVKPLPVKPNLYAYYFIHLKKIALEFGYNLVVHGSINRDLDLIAIPWVNAPKPEIEMINALTDWVGGKLDKTMIGTLPGGRTSYVINLNRGGYKKNLEGLIIDPLEFVEDPQYYIDISVTPCGSAKV